MTRLKVHFILYIFIVFLIASCGEGSDSEGNTKKIVAIGDSIGTGFGIANPWPPRLARLINRDIENASVSGQETDFGLGLIQQLIDDNNPSHVFILLGTNDAIRGSTSAAIKNLQAMVDIAQSNGVIAVVGTLPPITRSSTEDQRAEEISQGIKNLRGARIANIRALLGSGNDTIGDGVHPNDQGQQFIAEGFSMQF